MVLPAKSIPAIGAAWDEFCRRRDGLQTVR